MLDMQVQNRIITIYFFSPLVQNEYPNRETKYLYSVFQGGTLLTGKFSFCPIIQNRKRKYCSLRFTTNVCCSLRFTSIVCILALGAGHTHLAVITAYIFLAGATC